MAKSDFTLPEGMSQTDCHTRRAEVTEEIKRNSDATSALSKERSLLDSERFQLLERMSELKGEANVSEHALLRYLERRYDFDSEAVRQEMLSPAVRAAIEAGASGVKVEGGSFKISGTTVVTYLLSEKRRRKKRVET